MSRLFVAERGSSDFALTAKKQALHEKFTLLANAGALVEGNEVEVDIKSAISSADTDWIVNLCRYDEAFARYCASDALKAHWVVPIQQQLGALCHYFECAESYLGEAYSCEVDLECGIGMTEHFCGLNLLLKAIDLCKAGVETELSPEANALLLEAIAQFKSIHALQYYNRYRYQQIEQLKLAAQENFDDIVASFSSIIADCEKMVSHYGNYALMMVAEAHLRYANFLRELPDKSTKQCQIILTAFARARNVCSRIGPMFEKNEAVIAFASLGRGLASSNAFGYADASAFTLKLSSLQRNRDETLDEVVMEDRIFSRLK